MPIILGDLTDEMPAPPCCDVELRPQPPQPPQPDGGMPQPPQQTMVVAMAIDIRIDV